MPTSHKIGMPGRIAPAFLLGLAPLAFSALGLGAVPAHAQNQGSVQAPPSLRPVPDQLELAKMIWSTLLAVDHANRSGNYSVLRDMSAQGFQINNDPARLTQLFASLRESRVDLSNTLVLAPTFFEPPRQLQADVFQVKGVFQLRPTAIQFDLYYQWEQGRWKLFGIDLQPISLGQVMPGAPPLQQSAPARRPARGR